MILWLIIGVALVTYGLTKIRATRPLRPGEPLYEEMRHLLHVPDQDVRGQGMLCLILGALSLLAAFA